MKEGRRGRGLSVFICGLLAVLGVVDGQINDQVNVRYVHVKSEIQSRFATTLITTRLINPTNESKEVFFTAQLPDAAFISNFSVQIGDKLIIGEVKEKEQARAAYEDARDRGESAGLVAKKPRETNVFTISTNAAALDKVTFNLTYQEILKRVHGAYKHVINLQSDRLDSSSEVLVRIRITEQGLIRNVSVPRFGEKIGEKTNSELLEAEQEPDAQITNESTPNSRFSTTSITYRPNSNASNLAGQLVVLYDVDRNTNGGDLQVVNGYFVHFFAPSGLSKGSKHVVFVLDKSGSMDGRKFEQTKAAMRRILADLSEGDLFNIIMFSSIGQRWKEESVRASTSKVQEAIGYINRSVAEFSLLPFSPAYPHNAMIPSTTNIYDPLIDALTLLNTSSNSPSSPLVSMIIFMTDGQPNAGTISNPDAIVSSITERNRDSKFIVHSIAFGNDADFSLVQKLSGRNFGLARKVYEDLDADIQLTGFYDEISSPMLTNVRIRYLNESIDVRSLIHDQQTQNYYDGGELVAFGKLKDPERFGGPFGASINARGANGQVVLVTQGQTLICDRRSVMEDEWQPPCCVYPMCPIGNGTRYRDANGVTTTSGTVPQGDTIGGFIERMWAYETIKKLLRDAEEADGNTAVEKKAEALRLSLKYHFVTDLTSMVVIQPDNKNSTTALRSSKQRDPISRMSDPRNGVAFMTSDPGRMPPYSIPMSHADAAISIGSSDGRKPIVLMTSKHLPMSHHGYSSATKPAQPISFERVPCELDLLIVLLHTPSDDPMFLNAYFKLIRLFGRLRSRGITIRARAILVDSEHPFSYATRFHFLGNRTIDPNDTSDHFVVPNTARWFIVRAIGRNTSGGERSLELTLQEAGLTLMAYWNVWLVWLEAFKTEREFRRWSEHWNVYEMMKRRSSLLLDRQEFGGKELLDQIIHIPIKLIKCSYQAIESPAQPAQPKSFDRVPCELDVLIVLVDSRQDHNFLRAYFQLIRLFGRLRSRGVTIRARSILLDYETSVSNARSYFLGNKTIDPNDTSDHFVVPNTARWIIDRAIDRNTTANRSRDDILREAGMTLDARGLMADWSGWLVWLDAAKNEHERTYRNMGSGMNFLYLKRYSAKSLVPEEFGIFEPAKDHCVRSMK